MSSYQAHRIERERKNYKSNYLYSVFIILYIKVVLISNLDQINKLKNKELFGIYNYLWINICTYAIEIIFYARAKQTVNAEN